ncbi:MAG TPA: antitoxin Xre/MbcA/ParS toxin-binding domain-containing protein [Longimicrobium sp.]|jgi:putative toxin-antitoxin system antitoxin component (TIGR02293 family)
MTTYDVAEMLGGGQVFVGRVIRSDLDLVEAVQDGLPMAAVSAVVERSALTVAEVEQIVFLHGSAAERMGCATLTPEESDRLARVARVTALASETIGDPVRAAGWLRTRNRALGGAVPIELLRSGEGGRIVEETLLQVAHGLFA